METEPSAPPPVAPAVSAAPVAPVAPAPEGRAAIPDDTWMSDHPLVSCTYTDPSIKIGVFNVLAWTASKPGINAKNVEEKHNSEYISFVKDFFDIQKDDTLPPVFIGEKKDSLMDDSGSKLTPEFLTDFINRLSEKHLLYELIKRKIEIENNSFFTNDGVAEFYKKAVATETAKAVVAPSEEEAIEATEDTVKAACDAQPKWIILFSLITGIEQENGEGKTDFINFTTNVISVNVNFNLSNYIKKFLFDTVPTTIGEITIEKNTLKRKYKMANIKKLFEIFIDYMVGTGLNGGFVCSGKLRNYTYQNKIAWLNKIILDFFKGSESENTVLVCPEFDYLKSNNEIDDTFTGLNNEQGIKYYVESDFFDNSFSNMKGLRNRVVFFSSNITLKDKEQHQLRIECHKKKLDQESTAFKLEFENVTIVTFHGKSESYKIKTPDIKKKEIVCLFEHCKEIKTKNTNPLFIAGDFNYPFQFDEGGKMTEYYDLVNLQDFHLELKLSSENDIFQHLEKQSMQDFNNLKEKYIPELNDIIQRIDRIIMSFESKDDLKSKTIKSIERTFELSGARILTKIANELCPSLTIISIIKDLKKGLAKMDTISDLKKYLENSKNFCERIIIILSFHKTYNIIRESCSINLSDLNDFPFFGAMTKQRLNNLNNAQINKGESEPRFYGTDYIIYFTSKEDVKPPTLTTQQPSADDVKKLKDEGNFYPFMGASTWVSATGGKRGKRKTFRRKTFKKSDKPRLSSVFNRKGKKKKSRGGKRSKKNNLLRNNKKNIKIKKRSLRRQKYLQKCKSKKM